MKKFKFKTQNIAAMAAATMFCLMTVFSSPASASTSVGYDFDSAGDLSNGFNSYTSSGTVVQSATGGINNSGAINVSSLSANAVFASKASYSLGPVGSTYTFSSFMQSVGNSGYSGMGFTSLSPSSSNASGTPYRPTDALGISVHGGGFVFHNEGTNYSGSWGTSNSGIVTVKQSTISDLLNSGSPTDKWYKVVLIITRDSLTTFDMRVEVWSSYANGTLIRPLEADAIFEKQNLTNSTLSSAASINTYLNFSGTRVYYFDNYQVSLAGGSSVIQAGTPVVLTTQAVDSSNVVTFDGAVTATGGSAVIERGFVYGTSPNPTINDNKVPVGSGVGSFQGLTSTLPNGTYYFRAYATNSTGTSYGVEEQKVLTASVSIPQSPAPTPSNSSIHASPAAAQTALADTGQPTGLSLIWALGIVALGALFMRVSSSMNSRIKANNQ
ncbi:MAG: hypothetical protein RL720_1013 [Actinomycetota bacterium]